MQLTQLSGHHVALQGDHGDVAGDDLLAGGVQRHVVLVGHVGLAEGGQTGSLLRGESDLGLLWAALHAVEAGGV